MRSHACGALGDGAEWSILSEELRVGHRRVVELVVIVLGAVEKLSVAGVQLVVILRELDVEVVDPAEFAVDVAVLGELRVVRHARALHLVLIVGVQLSLWVDHVRVSVLELLTEVLLCKEGERLDSLKLRKEESLTL